MMRKMITLVLMVLGPTFAVAQLKNNVNGLDIRNVLRYGLNPVGMISGSLLDPNKFHMTQSYIMSVGSLGGQSISQAMYLNTMSYQITNPLCFTLQWGYLMNQPFGSQAAGLNNALPFKDGFFISGAQLQYKPSTNTEIKLEFRQVPYDSYYYRNPYYNW